MSYTNIVKSVTGSSFRHDKNNASSGLILYSTSDVNDVLRGALVAGAVVSVGWMACKLTPIIWQQLKNLVSSQPEAENIVNAADVPQRRPVGNAYTTLKEALVKGYASNIEDVARLLNQASETDRNKVIAKIISVRNENGETALHQAIRKGNASTINAFSNLLAMLPEDMRNIHLKRVLQDTLLYLEHALESRSVGMIEAFIRLVELLPCTERDALLLYPLTVTNEQGQTRLDIILAEGERNTIKSVAFMVGLLSPNICDYIILGLLNKKNNNGEIKLHSLVRTRGDLVAEGIASLLYQLDKPNHRIGYNLVTQLIYSASSCYKKQETLDNKNFLKSSEYLYSLFCYKKGIKVESKLLDTKMVDA